MATEQVQERMDGWKEGLAFVEHNKKRKKSVKLIKDLSSSEIVEIKALLTDRISSQPLYFNLFTTTITDELTNNRFLNGQEGLALARKFIVAEVYSNWSMQDGVITALKTQMEDARANTITRNITDLQMYVAIRPDLYTETDTAGRRQDFDYDLWIPRTANTTYDTAITGFTGNSPPWSINHSANTSQQFIDRMDAEIIANKPPHFYGTTDHSSNTYLRDFVMTDLRNEKYRNWYLRWLDGLVKTLKPNGFVWDLKTGWNAAPMDLPVASPAITVGDALVSTFYKTKEFELSVVSMAKEIVERFNVPMSVIDSQPNSAGPGSWFSTYPIFGLTIEGTHKNVIVPQTFSVVQNAVALLG